MVNKHVHEFDHNGECTVCDEPMSAAESTPGPWKARINKNNLNEIKIAGGYPIRTIAKVLAFPDDSEKPNARLIAAAPEMKDTIQHMLSDFAVDHTANMIAEFKTFEQHRKKEPNCTYCWHFKNAKSVLAKSEGRA